MCSTEVTQLRKQPLGDSDQCWSTFICQTEQMEIRSATCAPSHMELICLLIKNLCCTCPSLGFHPFIYRTDSLYTVLEGSLERRKKEKQNKAL